MIRFLVASLVLVFSCSVNAKDYTWQLIGSSSDETCVFYGDYSHKLTNGHVTMWIKTVCQRSDGSGTFASFDQSEYDCDDLRSRLIANRLPPKSEGGMFDEEHGADNKVTQLDPKIFSWSYVFPNTIGEMELQRACNVFNNHKLNK